MSTSAGVPCLPDVGADVVPVPINPISTEHLVLGDKVKPDEVADVSPHPRLARVCSALGMLPRAAESWAARFTRPLATLVCTLSATVLSHTALAILFFGGFPWPTLTAIIPEAMFLACGFYVFLGLYFCGPTIMDIPSTRPVMILFAPAYIYLNLTPFVGSIAFVPFSNRVIAAAGLSVAILGLDLVAQVLAQARREKNVPKLAVETLMLLSVIGSIRQMNNLTDYGFVRILITQVQRQECFWFATPSSCSKYIALAVLAAVFPAMTMVKDLVASLGTQEERGQQKLQRFLRPAVLLCQLGEVVVTLLKLFSDARTAAVLSAKGVDKSTLRREMAFQLVSCGFSIATFTVSAIGFRKVMMAVRVTTARVSRRASSVGAAMHRRLSAVGVSPYPGAFNPTVHPLPPASLQAQGQLVQKQVLQ